MQQNQKHFVQFKLDAKELFQKSDLSYREVANIFNMNNSALIASWMRQFRAVVSMDSQKRRDVHLSCLRKMKSKIRNNLQLKQSDRINVDRIK